MATFLNTIVRVYESGDREEMESISSRFLVSPAEICVNETLLSDIQFFFDAINNTI